MTDLDSKNIKLNNITLVPYQNAMVDVSMLTTREREYYNECNEKCIRILGNYLGKDGLEFLKENSYPL
jgi:hypothetical protein